MKKYFLILFLFFFGVQLQGANKINIGLIVDDNISCEVIDVAIQEIERYYNSRVHIIKNIELPIEFKKDTINAVKLIDYTQKEYPLHFYKYIFLTSRGIALNDNANYSTRGYAIIGGKIGVVSTLVVEDETISKKHFEDMLGKVLIHEMAHLLGLKHCIANEKCVLVSGFPTKLKRFQNAEKILCASCLEKIDKKIINKKYRTPQL